ncbi:ferritin-like protein [Persicobacter diffluens]|uniref:Iminophenyl-pyruvate dimer synthase domain-containing protein n=1 Tax=Persicobacter diffluens TaxID=981 RepID=A0AAN5APA5_9BACT|nr:hypothetical protein PEDI_41800 [Persicobacter diffluens]
MALTPINTLEDLYDYLYAAIQLEHATIPPYLTAMYSIMPEHNLEAYNLIRVVVVEEMLHLTLSANILNAIGGTPDLSRADFCPLYPAYLPSGETDFTVSLEKFSKNCIETFLNIERPAKSPEKVGKQPHFLKKPLKEMGGNYILPTVQHDDGEHYHFYSIGEFYHAIEEGLEKIAAEIGEDALFCGDASKQITSDFYYSGGGEIITVTDLASAKAAIRLISEQGEGYEGGIFDYEGELAHYYRFEQLILGKYYHPGDEAGKPSGEPLDIDWNAVYPILTNARLEDYPENSEVRRAAADFNQVYKTFLDKLTKAFNGAPETLIPAVSDMFVIKDKMYQIVRNPAPGTAGNNAAPTFELSLVSEQVKATEGLSYE